MTETLIAAGGSAAHWGAFLTISGIWALTVVTPGPNFLATVQTAMCHSRRHGVLVSAGISCGTTIWAAASLFGLAIIFETAGWLYHLLKWLGAIYLIWIGLRMLVSSCKGHLDGGSIDLAAADLAPFGAFRRGLLVDLANPKAAAFFTSLFAVALPPGAPGWFQLLVVGSVVVIAGGWYALVALSVTLPSVTAIYRRIQRGITAVCGGVFMFFGASLAASDRP